MNRIAVIPARGGSKRIPRKNIKHFCGAPIISYSIRAAINSGLFDEIMVSTDDEEIREISLSYGAHVPFLRSEQTANDQATTASVIQEVIQSYGLLGKQFNQLLCLYPCAPLISEELIHKTLDRLMTGNFDCVYAVAQFSSPIQRALVFKDGKLEMLHPEFELTRSQDLQPSYFDAGQLYWLDTKKFKEYHSLRPPNSSAVIVNDLFVQDIDTIEDWELAEAKYQYLKAKGYLS